MLPLCRMLQMNAFNGCLVDFTTCPKPAYFKKALQNLVANQREKGTHVFSLKIPGNNGCMIKTAIECGFRHHHANHHYSFLNLCLKNHKVEECTYPPYRTISAGVTAVIFDRELKNVLVVWENFAIHKYKPPTGTIEYGQNQETPLDAVVREVKEETQIDLDPTQAFHIASTWSNNYRDINPDIAFIFAFIMDQKKEPVAQKGEILKAKWMPVEEFFQTPPEEKEKPWLLRQVVVVAHNALKNNKFWKKDTVYFTTGKPVDLFSGRTCLNYPK